MKKCFLVSIVAVLTLLFATVLYSRSGVREFYGDGQNVGVAYVFNQTSGKMTELDNVEGESAFGPMKINKYVVYDPLKKLYGARSYVPTYAESICLSSPNRGGS
jgi:hypothetical protein